MLILILIDVQYSQNAVFSFEKGLNCQNLSSSGSYCLVKKALPPLPAKFLIPLHWGRNLTSPSPPWRNILVIFSAIKTQEISFNSSNLWWWSWTLLTTFLSNWTILSLIRQLEFLAVANSVNRILYLKKSLKLLVTLEIPSTL